MGAIHRVIPADHHGGVWWFHGNSGGGKTRIAIEFSKPGWIVLDADDAREVWTDLEWSEKDRREQNFRLARLAMLICKQGVNVVVASICPYADQRGQIKEMIPWLTWVYVAGPDARPASEEYPFEEGGWT